MSLYLRENLVIEFVSLSRIWAQSLDIDTGEHIYTWICDRHTPTHACMCAHGIHMHTHTGTNAGNSQDATFVYLANASPPVCDHVTGYLLLIV